MKDLRDRVLARLGFSRPPATDLDGLRALYAAWCARVPFDNVRKMIALRAGDGRPLPGGDAEDFFEHWLAHGAGGTCWPTSNALFELVHACGFAARRVAGSMRDLGDVNHASVKVRIDGLDWLVDSSMLTNVPLRLDSQVFTSGRPGRRSRDRAGRRHPHHVGVLAGQRLAPAVSPARRSGWRRGVPGGL